MDVARTTLGTLILALFYDLATEKDFRVPTQPERRERALRDLIRKRHKPIALLVDDAHSLHGKTLLGLKRLREIALAGTDLAGDRRHDSGETAQDRCLGAAQYSPRPHPAGVAPSPARYLPHRRPHPSHLTLPECCPRAR